VAKRKAIESTEPPKPLPPALTLEGRENQLIAASYDLAERRILEGTASSQELTYFLKLGSSKTRLENEKLKEEVTHLKAKTAALEAQISNEALLDKALKAFRSYRGEDEGEDDDYEDVF
jgi:hypothetical protein